MIRGWLHDHDWRLLGAALVAGAAALVAGRRTLDNPLGTSYVGLSPELLLFLVGSAGFILCLPSRAARSLGVHVPRGPEAVWLLVTGAATACLGWAAHGFAPDAASVVHGLAWTACLPALAARFGGEGVGLLVVFGLFAACLMTPRDAVIPWWNPVLTEVDDPWRMSLALLLVVVFVGLHLGGGAPDGG